MSKVTERRGHAPPQTAHLLQKDYRWVRSRLLRAELSGRQIAGRSGSWT